MSEHKYWPDFDQRELSEMLTTLKHAVDNTPEADKATFERTISRIENQLNID